MSYFKAKLLCLPLVITMLFSIVTVGSLANYSLDAECNEDAFVSDNLAINAPIMNYLFVEDYSEQDAENNSAEISIGYNKESVQLVFDYNNTDYIATLSGTYNEINTDSGIGYVGVYEGFASPVFSSESTSINTSQIPIIADITFDNTDIFAVLTLGYISGTSIPDMLFFGDFSDNIKNIADVNSMQYMEEAQSASVENSTPILLPRIDGATKLQVVDPATYVYDTVTGILSIYHSDELSNQGIMSIYAKVNTNCELFKNLMQESYNDGTPLNHATVLYARASKFDISISGQNNNLHAVANSYIPQNEQSSVNILVPYYSNFTGFGTISFPIVTSSTSVTTSANANSPHPNNTVSWSLDKTVGWNSDDFDGQHSESKGMSVYSNYTFEGNVENPIYQVRITAGANIQYVYVVNMPGIGGGATIQCHTNSEPLATESYVDIIP